MAVHLTDQNFKQEVLESSKPVLVDFWATWCGPCQMMGPILEALAEDVKDFATVAKLDVDENPATAQQYGIMSIPTLKIFKDGKIVKEFVGVQQKDMLKAELEKVK